MAIGLANVPIYTPRLPFGPGGQVIRTDDPGLAGGLAGTLAAGIQGWQAGKAQKRAENREDQALGLEREKTNAYLEAQKANLASEQARQAYWNNRSGATGADSGEKKMMHEAYMDLSNRIDTLASKVVDDGNGGKISLLELALRDGSPIKAETERKLKQRRDWGIQLGLEKEPVPEQRLYSDKATGELYFGGQPTGRMQMPATLPQAIASTPAPQRPSLATPPIVPDGKTNTVPLDTRQNYGYNPSGQPDYIAIARNMGATDQDIAKLMQILNSGDEAAIQKAIGRLTGK